MRPDGGSDAGPSSRSRRLGLRPPQPRPAEDDGAARSSSSSPGMNKRVVAMIGAVTLAVLGGVAGTMASYWLAPAQQVRQQQGLDAAQDQADASNPAVLVQSQRYASEVRSEATSRVLDLSSVPLSAPPPPIIIPPGQNIQPGPLSNAKAANSAQPPVYDQMFFTLVGNHYKTVKVISIAARIVSRELPPSGTLLWKSPQGASSEESFGFDLDSNDLEAHTTILVGDIPELTPHHNFDDRQVTLARDEKLEFKASVFTASCLCRFVFDVKTDDGRTQTVDNNGSPWQVSAFSGSYQRAYAVDLGSPHGLAIVACDWPAGCLKY
jgi:hypothetical protein